ncbi:MAG: c-type cytochrome [Woeseia sp.]
MRNQFAAVILGLTVCTMIAAEPRTINDAVYSKAQAEIGERLYKEYCLACHDRKYFRPVLKAWDGQPLELFFMAMSSSMPQGNPGSLRDKEYIDILAYILSLSRYRAGDAELDYRDGGLNEILIAKRE